MQERKEGKASMRAQSMNVNLNANSGISAPEAMVMVRSGKIIQVNMCVDRVVIGWEREGGCWVGRETGRCVGQMGLVQR